MIQFKNVTKTYPGQHVGLKEITLDIPDGSFVYLIGPSGAGKTTLLRLLTREITPNSGEVIVEDVQVHKLPLSKVHVLRRKVGMIFQDFKILTDRTVFENIAIGLEILDKKQKEIGKGVRDVLELVGLPDKINSFPLQLSAGELQRVSIARALVGGPKILLADEPTGNLDPDTSWKILEILEEINKLGTTIVMATHNSDIVNHSKKRTISLSGGSVVSDEKQGSYKLSKHVKKDTHK